MIKAPCFKISKAYKQQSLKVLYTYLLPTLQSILMTLAKTMNVLRTSLIKTSKVTNLLKEINPKVKIYDNGGYQLLHAYCLKICRI